MGSPHLPQLTTSLLHSYSEAALRNADELLVESLLLHDHDHMARAYFLAVSCIEETGKALFAFDSQHRNLTDPAVCKKLKTSLENHGQKISYALSIWALSSPDPYEAMMVAQDLIVHVKLGREPSMYSDLRTDPDRVQTPREIVRATAARDCVRLAENCLAHAHRHVSGEMPAKFTTAHGRLFTMKSAKFQEMLSAEDFWWYYISCMEAGQQDIAEAVFGYERDHIKTGTLFRAAR
jgi:AbiV family abortive infection protein